MKFPFLINQLFGMLETKEVWQNLILEVFSFVKICSQVQGHMGIRTHLPGSKSCH